MNKKVFTGLVILMGVSILGIIIVQLIWMNNALQVKNELFRRGVNEALTNTVNRLEDVHNLGIVNEMIFDDSVRWVHEMDGTVEIDMNHETEFHVLPSAFAPNKKGMERMAKLVTQII